MRSEETRMDGADRLVPLSSLKNFKVAKDNPDARGWKVVGSDGERLGIVKDLIVDPQEMKARYLSMEVDRRFFDDKDDHYLLVPIGAATLDREDNKVFVPIIDSQSIARYPIYGGGRVTDDYEYAVRERLMGRDNRDFSDNNETRTYTQPEPVILGRPVSNDFYNNDNYNESKFYDAPRQDRFDNRPDYDRQDNRQWQPAVGYNQDNSFNSDNNSRKDVTESISTIERLESLRERGSITEDEFRTLKRRALDS